MGALANAAALIQDATFAQWMTAAAAYQARLVIGEPESTPDHAIRLVLAKEVAVSPHSAAARLVTIVGTDPAIAAQGDNPAAIPEADILAAVAAVWTTLAHLIHPEIGA